MSQPRRRVSFIISPPTSHVARLRLPPHGMQRLGATGPLLTPYNARATPDVEDSPAWARHPRHRLGISSLALDDLTHLAGTSSPRGILYSGGRDGLIIAWDLGVPMKRRRTKSLAARSRVQDRWELITGWSDDTIEEEGEEEEKIGPDGDVLGDVISSSRRQRSARDPPLKQQWEADMSSFKPGTHSEFRQCAQAHSDWINDIVLCNHNQTVISASSDGTVKSWSPHAAVPSDPAIIGSHTDYVRCLSLCREQNWVASGSFDRTIKLWDISRTSQEPLVTLNPADASAPKSSVYALASDPFGRTIASGSPERVVRMWDPRSGKRTGKLVGHTDNIRDILISEDSRYLLTGSADASIKLWSLASQRCLHTFTHHTESVWSLNSSHPNLENFYSGDRCGLVCRVDVEGCGDLSEGECVLLCNDTSDGSRSATEGINRLAVLHDSLLWTASGTSTIKRWRIPSKRVSRISASAPIDADGDRLPSAPLKRRLPISNELVSEAGPTPRHGRPDRMSSIPSMRSQFSESRERGISFDIFHGIPFDSMIKLLSPNDPFTTYTQNRNRDPEVATLYSAASIMSVRRGSNPFTTPQNSFQYSHGSPLQSSRTEDTMVANSAARANYEDRDLASEATPYCTQPDDVLVGENGLVRSIILNDRRHVLTVDTSGEVAVWDVVRGQCLGRYLREDVAAASHSGSVDGGSGENEQSPREALEAVRERIEGEAVISTWCTADTKAGVLAIHLNERCFDAEVYADEVGFSHDKYFNDESKLNIGKWVLKNLFLGFIREEMNVKKLQESPSPPKDGFLPPSVTRGDRPHPPESPRRPRHRLSSSIDSSRRRHKNSPASSAVVNSPKMIPAVPPVVTNFPRSSPLISPLIPLTPAKDMLPPIFQSATSSPNESAPSASPHQRSRSGTVEGYMNRIPSGTGKDDYFSVRTRQQSLPSGGPDDTPGTPGTPRPEAHTPSTPSGLMGRLKSFSGKITKRPVSEKTSPSLGSLTPTAETMGASQGVADVPKTPMQVLLAGALTPPGNADAPLHPLPAQTVVLITEEATPTYRTVYRGHVAAMQHEVSALEEAMPMWLAEYLLLNKIPPSAPLVKLSFVLLPWNKDPNVEPLPELLNTAQSKLTASRYLRIAKILQHVQDKLEKVAGGADSKATSARSSLDTNNNQHQQQQQQQQQEQSKGSSCRPRAEDLYEVLCNEALLPLDMTLASVRQYVWRQSGELVMHYRQKVQDRRMMVI